MAFVFPRYAPTPEELGYSGRIGAKPDKPENLLLQVAYEGGLAALAPFVMVLGLSLKSLRRAIPRATGRLKCATFAILVGSVSYLAQQQFSFSTLSSSPVFWSILGIGVALCRPHPPASGGCNCKPRADSTIRGKGAAPGRGQAKHKPLRPG